MPKNTKKDSAKTGASSNKSGGEGAPHASESADSERFVRDVLTRGEAVKQPAAETEEKLPNGATHVVTGENEDGTPRIKRARYNAF